MRTPGPHVEHKQPGACELPEAGGRDDETHARGGHERRRQLGYGARRRRQRYHPVDGLGETRTVSPGVARRAREHPGRHAHDDHQHEADEQEMNVGGDEQPRWIPADDELGHGEIAAKQQPHEQEDETRLDVAANQGRHAPTVAPPCYLRA
jgi:hypothetical protein